MPAVPDPGCSTEAVRWPTRRPLAIVSKSGLECCEGEFFFLAILACLDLRAGWISPNARFVPRMVLVARSIGWLPDHMFNHVPFHCCGKESDLSSSSNEFKSGCDNEARSGSLYGGKSNRQEFRHNGFRQVGNRAAGYDATALHRIVEGGLANKVKMLFHQKNTDAGLFHDPLDSALNI
jgi:hypothetical protein